MSENKSVIRAGQVLECLFENGFQGKTTDHIALQLEIPGSTVWRILQSWKVLGWVVELPIAGSKSTCWKISNQLTKIANAYEQHALNKVQGIRSEFHEITGKELKA